ncbi:hypothetical protein TWF730_002562 [Orbilia blumenaviensis]|uniref:Uncharacterized protein n=1 Tax=Orbilia blumenaviensis TaxID=1796055 RepID=A0AAV9UB42_9PEZI
MPEIYDYKPVFLTASVDPKSYKITNYDLWVENCSKSGGKDKKYHGIPILANHPLLKELAILESRCTSSHKSNKGKSFSKLAIAIQGFIRFSNGYAIEINCDQIRVDPDTTVHDLTQETWGVLKDAYTSDLYSCPQKFKQVKFMFLAESNVLMGNWAEGRPVFQVELAVEGNVGNQWSLFKLEKK